MFPNYRDQIKHLEMSALSEIRRQDHLRWDCFILLETFINVNRKLGGKMAGVRMVWPGR